MPFVLHNSMCEKLSCPVKRQPGEEGKHLCFLALPHRLPFGRYLLGGQKYTKMLHCSQSTFFSYTHGALITSLKNHNREKELTQ